MQSIIDDIIMKLREANLEIEVPDENIDKNYPTSIPSLTKPYIYVSEIANVPNEMTITDKEEYSDLSYQIDVYSKQQNVNGEFIAADDVVHKLGMKISDVLSSELGLFRIGTNIIMPYSFDNTVQRYVLTFNGVLDLTHGYIYRR